VRHGGVAVVAVVAMTRDELSATIEQTLIDSRGGQRRGSEITFRCVFPEQHRNRDEHPSASWSCTKRAWFCRACGARGGYIDLARTLGIQTHAGARRSVASYDYVDEVGGLLYQVVRFEPKTFRQRRRDASQKWVWNLDGVRRVPYRLPELVAADPQGPVFIVEGERDVDALRALGLVATCNAGGASKWRAEYNEHLRNRHVVVIPDADEPGRRHADDVVRHLLSVAASVRQLELHGAKDVSDWIAASHTANELLELAQHTPLVTHATDSGATTRGLTFTRVGDLLAEPDAQDEWLVDGLLPAGGFGVLVGKPKAGKSTLARNLCRSVAHGEHFLSRTVQQGAVLYLALEEKRSQVKAHFKALGIGSDAPLKVFVGTSPIDGLAQLAAALEREPAVLVVIDPLFRFIRVRDGNDYAAMTAALDPVLGLAHNSGACVLVTHHAPKGERADIDAPIGSTAIAGSADVVLVLKRSDRYRTLSSVQRTGEDLPETVVELDPATCAVRVAETRHDTDLAAMKTAIVEYLTPLSEPADEPTIDASIEGRTRTKREALRALITDGKLSRIGTGRRGDPYRYRVPRDSCSLVPPICQEQENDGPKSGGNARQSSMFACSGDLVNSQSDGNKNSDPSERESTREVIEI
jgi:5S rRNA maturation endonuclease (ribonuclease M5)